MASNRAWKRKITSFRQMKNKTKPINSSFCCGCNRLIPRDSMGIDTCKYGQWFQKLNNPWGGKVWKSYTCLLSRNACGSETIPWRSLVSRSWAWGKHYFLIESFKSSSSIWNFLSGQTFHACTTILWSRWQATFIKRLFSVFLTTTDNFKLAKYCYSPVWCT